MSPFDLNDVGVALDAAQGQRAKRPQIQPARLDSRWLETQNGGPLYRRRAIDATNGAASPRAGRR